MNEIMQDTLCRRLCHLINDYKEAYDSEDFHFYQGFMYCMKILGYYIEFTFDTECLMDGFICNGKTYKLADY